MRTRVFALAAIVAVLVLLVKVGPLISKNNDVGIVSANELMQMKMAANDVGATVGTNYFQKDVVTTVNEFGMTVVPAVWTAPMTGREEAMLIDDAHKAAEKTNTYTDMTATTRAPEVTMLLDQVLDAKFALEGPTLPTNAPRMTAPRHRALKL